MFPRWYARDWKEAGALGPTLAGPESPRAKGFEETVRDYLDRELTNHPEEEPRGPCSSAGRGTLPGARCSVIPTASRSPASSATATSRKSSSTALAAVDAVGPQRQRQVGRLRRVTYALFGHHRGGGQQRGRTHQQGQRRRSSSSSNSCSTASLYRVAADGRSDAKAGGARGTQQICQLAWPAPTAGRWEPEPQTQLRAEFDAWVRNTSASTTRRSRRRCCCCRARPRSCSTPSRRAGVEVLAGIVDLERYQRLHGKADGQRKALERNSKRSSTNSTPCRT